MRPSNGWMYFVSASTLALASNVPVHAQESADDTAQDASGQAETGPPAIIVTARKRAEDVQEIPAVVTALSAEDIEELGGANNTRDLIQLLPGVTFIDAASSTTAEPNIRGAGQARLPNSDSAIGLYRDGAFIAGGNLGGRSFQRFDLFDIERAEVLRGPQGALYGRNAVGGAINIISQKPLFESSGEAQLEYGSRDTINASLIANQQASETVAIRAGFDFSDKSDCVYTRGDNGKCFDFLKYVGVRGSLRWKPSDSFDLTFMADYSDSASDSGGATLQRTGNPPITIFQTNGIGTIDVDQFALSMYGTYEFDWGQLVSTTNYRKRDSVLRSDPDGIMPTATTNGLQQDTRSDDTETFFQELRLQGEADRLNWLVGADFYHIKNDYLIQERGRAIIPGMAATMTTPATAAIDPNSDLGTLQIQDSYSFFGSLEYELFDGFKAQGEARYAVDAKSAIITAVLLTGGPRYVDFPPGSPQTQPSRTFKNTSWGATLSYQVADPLLIYVRAATAYRAGGFNSELGNPCGPGETPGVNCNNVLINGVLSNVPASYNEETSLTYEVGIKTSWFDNQLILNANAYSIDYDDLLANLNNGIMAMTDPLNGAMFLANVGKARAEGLEVEMMMRPEMPDGWGDLRISLNVGHQTGTFKTSVIGSVAVGNDLARLRPLSANTNVVWSLPIASDWSLVSAFTFRHEEGGFQGAENDLILGDFNIYGLRFALQSEQWTAALRISNLTNARYFVNQSGATISPGIGDLYRLNDPRSVTASVTFRW